MLSLLLFALFSTVPPGRPARAAVSPVVATAQTAQAASSRSVFALQALSPAAAPQGNVTTYTLPPELYRKAKALSRMEFLFNLVGFAYGVFVLWLVLHWKLAAKYRDWAEKASSLRLVQSFVFTPLLILTISLLEAPTAIYEHIVSRGYGLSVESWAALGWDWTKAIALLIVGGSILAWILYGVIRRNARRWWLHFWLILVPIIVFLSFVEPFVLEPIFFSFAPLQQKDPGLVAQLQRVVRRAGVPIPADRMFWMKASDKTPLMNAYVTGIGSSKRIVVWDTTLQKETTPEIVSVVGHEMGHYVLGHVWKGLIFSVVLLLVFLYLGYWCIRWLLCRRGAGWGIRGLNDWASLPALLLLLTIFSFVSDPITNAYSRHIEHQADVYGLEVTHGILPDAGQTAADSFQVEGQSSLSDPDPNGIDVFLFYDHPPIADRVRFCLTYDPWRAGQQPEFVK